MRECEGDVQEREGDVREREGDVREREGNLREHEGDVRLPGEPRAVSERKFAWAAGFRGVYGLSRD